MTRQEFFDKKNKGALWDVGVSINRTNPLPLDKFAVFPDVDSMYEYVSGVLSYPGQVVAVVGETSTDAYLLIAAGAEVAGNESSAIKKLASTTASGDVTDDIQKIQARLFDISAGNGIKLTESTNAAGHKDFGISIDLSAENDNILDYDTNNKLFASVKLKKNTDGSYSLVYGTDEKVLGEKITIDKDKFVKGGEVKDIKAGSFPGDFPEGYGAGKYIVITLSDDTNLYISVSDLVDVYTASGADAGTAVAVNIDDSNEISADLVDGKVQKKHLEALLKTSLDKADSAVQSVSVNTPADGTIKVDGVTETVVDIDAIKQSTISVIVGRDTDSSTDNTIKGAKKYADAAASAAIVVDDTAVEKKFVTAVKKTADGKISADRAALTANDIPDITVSKISDLDTELAKKQDTLEFTSIPSSTNKVVAKQELDAVSTTVNEISTTIPGMKTDITNLKTAVDTGDKTVSAAISDAISPVSEKADANATAIETINGTGAGSTSKKITDALADLEAFYPAKTGEFVTAVNQENGKITSVTTAAIKEHDLPSIVHTKISDWDTELAKKQDVIKTINNDYNKDTNPLVTQNDISGITGAMHYIGLSTTDPTSATGPTVTKDGETITNFHAGDVVVYNGTTGSKVNSEYVYDGTTWRELGSETSYIVKGTKFSDADIANDANIKQSKIEGLSESLNSKIDGVKIPGVADPLTPDASGDVTLPEASDTSFGLTKIDNSTIKKDADKKLYVANVSTDVLSAGTKTLILNCGNSVIE